MKKGKGSDKKSAGSLSKKSSLMKLSPEERAYFVKLHQIIDEIYSKATTFEWTWQKLSEQSDLGYRTVLDLGNRVTKYPRFQTIYKLAKSVGLNLSITNGQLKKVAKAA